MTRNGVGRIVLVGCVLAAGAVGVRAEELKVSSGGPARAIMEKWAKEYTQATGVKLQFTFGTVPKVQAKVAAGEPADLVFLAPEAMDELERQRLRWARSADCECGRPRSWVYD